ncbi:ABC transporter permease subunit [Fictibacillus terranigra]|uniref:Uncharacterized protein n=1 Tax=Fictibacillus terranigra TaxID=3058424 RepID=A0ABT8EB48_9BACL|nr:ABC transporter permease subunit [Fictibacillus sp. CENA-BCM004]MDN4075082.1 hypothetical protein [Fictibacillus sp. CENA-BCM004]
MNIFLHELKVNRKSMLIWAFALAAVTVLFFSIYPSVEKDGDQFIKVLQNYPEGVLKALGVQISTITSLLGFYSYFFLYVMLCGAIQAMNLGTGILSKEVSGKTAEFILTKPVTRASRMSFLSLFHTVWHLQQRHLILMKKLSFSCLRQISLFNSCLHRLVFS